MTVDTGSEVLLVHVKRRKRRRESLDRFWLHKTRDTMLGTTTLLCRLLLFFLLAETTFAQTVGVDICACQPATYEFTLDFDLTCEDSTVGGPGINASACIINTDVGQNVTDFRPVIVTNIQILELNQDFEVIAQTPISGTFVNGNTFRYTSVIAGRTADIPAVDVPRGFQLSMAGRNALEQDLVNFWLIIYNNDCGIFPIILEGQQIGWTILVRLEPWPCACSVCANVDAN